MLTPSKFPPNPNLTQLKNQAKDLRAALSGGDAAAAERVRTGLPGRQPATVGLRDAQLVIAREYGFESWRQLKDWYHSEGRHLWERIHSRGLPLLRTIERLHDPFTQMQTAVYSRLMGRHVDVDTAFADLTTYAEFVASIRAPACHWVFEMDGLEGPAVLDLAPPVARRLLGGVAEGGALNDEEVARLLPTVRQLLADLSIAWEPAASLSLANTSFRDDPASAELAAPYDRIYLIAFEVRCRDEAWGLVSLAYPITSVTGQLQLLPEEMGERRSAAST
jgi:hypothetical protein